MEKHALYRFYNDRGQLLYTGITNAPGRRFTEHAKEKHWWEDVRGIAIDWYDDRDNVLAAEKRAIRIENPEHNIRDKRARVTDEDEFTYEDYVHMGAAIAAASQRETSREFYKDLAEQVDAALAQGYSYREIVAAAEGFAWVEDSTVDDHLPVIPGRMHAQDLEDLNDARVYLAAFIPSEVEQFTSKAHSEPEMARAHAHEITIRAYRIAQEFMSTKKRDLEALGGFLKSSAKGRTYLEWAQEKSGTDAIFPLPIDCREVIESAVAWLLGTWTPENAPTTECRWRQLASDFR
ncbi:GIY-YIG nuclease family protein [Nocardiopsis sp. NPDC006198]|uniref:GIY-YIG nuclease family protein n=1 Tax=Nocardiopsis sp. NPDC006198 TaxID=3154472 RepID=UPI0033BB9F56